MSMPFCWRLYRREPDGGEVVLASGTGESFDVAHRAVIEAEEAQQREEHLEGLAVAVVVERFKHRYYDIADAEGFVREEGAVTWLPGPREVV